MHALKTNRLCFYAAAAIAFALAGSGCANADNSPGSMQAEQTLVGTAWWVEDIGDKGVIDNSHTTIEFTADGQVSGDTGCNRYFGAVEIDAAAIAFGPLASTRKACAPALMDQELKFFQAIDKVKGWEIADTGLLHLRDADGNTQLRASRTDQ